jgi:diguanylate cyclase (GGDEF)-like protein
MEMHSLHDGLTGALRRQPFMDRINEELKKAAVFHTGFSLLMVDIDHFKSVNDTHGHAAGDAALIAVGRLLETLIRAEDLVFRMGGDEFAVLLPEAALSEAQVLAELLRQRIFSNELAPGSWIDELRLAEAYGISRTPLREALKVLATEGLVTMKVRRGAYVTEVSDKDQRDVYHLLSLLESDATGVVAQQATEVELTELAQLHQELKAATQNTERFFEINEQFHMRLLEMANNRWRTQLVLDLRKVMKLNRHNSLFKSGRIEESLQEHQDIMDALLAHDAALSQQRMQTHFKNGLQAASSPLA